MTAISLRPQWGIAVTGFFLVASALFTVASAHADFVQVTYAINANGFQDSNGNPPDSPTSTLVEGIYTFTFDTNIAQQNNLVPDAVSGLDITANNGSVLDYDTTNSGVNIAVNAFQGTVRVVIGGTTSSVAYMVGLSNDFRVTFDIALDDFTVTNVFEHFVFVTPVDAFYAAQNTTVTLIDATVLPESDGDGVVDSLDNCVVVANANQRDTDGDGIGNLCDGDFDQDCEVNASDLGIMALNFFASGDLDTDLNGDGLTNTTDLGLLRAMFFLSPGPSGPGNLCSP